MIYLKSSEILKDSSKSWAISTMREVTVLVLILLLMILITLMTILTVEMILLKKILQVKRKGV